MLVDRVPAGGPPSERSAKSAGNLGGHADTRRSGLEQLPRRLLTRGLKTRVAGVLLISALTTFAVCRFSSSLSVPEFALLDLLLSSRPAQAPDPRIVIVGVERADIERHQETRLAECACQLVRRDDLGAAISRMKHAGARVVGVDISFSRACPVGLPERRAHDGPLVAALLGPPDTVLVADTGSTPDKLFFEAPPRGFLPASDLLIGSPVLYNPHGVIRGVSLVQRGAPPEVPRNGTEHLVVLGEQVPPLSAAVYAAYAGVPWELPEPLDATHVKVADQVVPVWAQERIRLMGPLLAHQEQPASDHAMLINWVGRTGTFPVYGLREVLSAKAEDLRARFGGRIVLIGSLQDRKRSALLGDAVRRTAPLVDQSGEAAMSGVEIHANALNTLLQHRWIRTVSTPMAWLVIFAAAVLASCAFRYLGTWRALIVAVVEAETVVVAAQLLIRYDVWLYAAVTVEAIAVSSVTTVLLRLTLASDQVKRLTGQIEARDSVASTLVHDLKQPLAAISALAEVLRMQQQRGTTPSPELLARIQQQVQMAFGDIDEFLILDHHRELVLECSDFDVAALAKDLAVAHGARSPVHRIEVVAPPGGVRLSGDPRYLARALSNLLDNAIKYWPDGGTILVSIAPGPPVCLIRVADGGIGIPAEKMGKVFEPYERAVPDALQVPGTGIGLSSVRRIAQAHGGDVWAESKVGEGSTFTIALPTELPPSTSAPQ